MRPLPLYPLRMYELFIKQVVHSLQSTFQRQANFSGEIREPSTDLILLFAYDVGNQFVD